jgi:acetamidase/formamidase
MTVYKIGRDTFHYMWNNEHKPVIEIRSGDSINFEINEVTSWQVTKNAGLENFIHLDMNKLYPLAGPVFVEGASEGDALEVIVEEIETDDWGFSGILPGFGLLPEFNEPYLKIWDLSKSVNKFIDFKHGIKVPLDPFCGVMGVAPKEKGAFPVLPPGKHGGNLDIRHLTIGSKLVLPVWTRGALFSVGDMHAAMGDGEVCLTAIESPGKVKLRFELIKDANIPRPRFFTKNKRESRPDGYFVTTGIASDLMESCRFAVRDMIDYLVKEHNLSRSEAYILCSVAGDLRIHEVVDAPNWVVGLWIANSVFGG